MGSLAVLSMTGHVDSRPEGAGRQPLHPFFAPSRPAAPVDVLENSHATDAHESNGQSGLSIDGAAEDKSQYNTEEKSSGGRHKRRKVDSDPDCELDVEPDVEGALNSRGKKRVKASLGNIANLLTRRTLTGSNSAGTGVGREEEERLDTRKAADEPNVEGVNGGTPSLRRPAEANDTTSPSTQVPSLAPDATLCKPKRMLQFNPKTGTIGSPPKPKPIPSKAAGTRPGMDAKQEPQKRGRKPASRIVNLVYGTDSESRTWIGERINAILSGQPSSLPDDPSKQPSAQPCKPKNTPRAPPVSAPVPNLPRKPPHPFFGAKPKKPDPASEQSKAAAAEPANGPERTKQFTSTPCSPKKTRPETPFVRAPQFGKSNLGQKHPGSRLPAWPCKDMVHVRGDNALADTGPDLSPLLSSRKSKGHAVKVAVSESVVEHVANGLHVPALAEAVRNVNTDDFLPAPPELRLPRKHFESGKKLQARILPELKTFLPASSSKKTTQRKQLTDRDETGVGPPPQLASLFESVSSGLSAFDKSQCETVNWAQKYAPSGAAEVLQPGREAFCLREWLQALMVQSVDTGSTAAASKTKTAGAGKKKRRKKLDGFIVSSEDEGYELEELSDGEDWAPSGVRGISRKTVVRPVDPSKSKDGAKLANALLISGPHGCGKTATVYAVAKELGFEVFEINSSSRRSGKDILEKIGDMTRNHLVQHHQPSKQAAGGDESTINEDEVASEIKSGKQKTMSAFFKVKAPVEVKPKDSVGSPGPAVQREAKRETPRSQKQSLILLEEVDILYEEDKQFWATVAGLMAQSKRPFIMTCNDETLVPLSTLRLHGIFRLSAPPKELAIDRLLLVAANEGHALKRQAVEALFESRNRDIRASTMDLQYWCQIGVGDRRGGFDWFYPRWPKGIDLDEHNEVVRVVSQETYNAGMNLLGRDSIVDPKVEPRLVEEELLHQAWESWGLDIGHWQDSLGIASWAQSMSPITTTRASRLAVLEAFDDIAEAMSMADIYSGRSFAMSSEEHLDATLPDLPAKTRDDFILGLPLLDTPCTTYYDSLTASFPCTIWSLAKSSLQARTQTLLGKPVPELQPLSESRVIDCIQNSFASPSPGTGAVSRVDFAFAFDPIAVADPTQVQPVYYLDPSIFDRTLELIVLDVAPYVRSIVAYEAYLQKQRLKLSNLVSEGGKAPQGSKRMRTTRAALSALEGGSRSTTRAERWFKADMNLYLVMRTAGEGWSGSPAEEAETPDSPTRALSTGSPGSSPEPIVPKVRGRGRGRKKKMIEEDSADELGVDEDASVACVG
ncbi:hypothetical protein B0T22DRAFT_309282 [Podospora appendiculata]|uniref:AAA+ ATPase domain-containing protein n=1 Tax=Podospora appendiculata TaxID=314037 RepID=A0AAE0WYN5_9PEZI|nr:hypothetical protein B0T22DRAFT_309282 [Podospora appendiculata]